MPTPADAPYKLAQRAAETARRRSRRFGVVDREKLVSAAKVAIGRLEQARSLDEVLRSQAARDLRSLRAAMTPHERDALGL